MAGMTQEAARAELRRILADRFPRLFATPLHLEKQYAEPTEEVARFERLLEKPLAWNIDPDHTKRVMCSARAMRRPRKRSG